MFSIAFPSSVSRDHLAPLAAGRADREYDPPSFGTPAAKHRRIRTTQSKAILWIDDEIEPEDPIIRLLASDGFRFDVAGTAAEGESRATARHYDAIILDLHFPNLFGLTLLQRLRASGIATPVLVVTGYYLEPEMEAVALKAGATAFAHKPLVDAAELRRVLDFLMLQPSPRSETAQAPVAGLASSLGIVAASAEMRRIIEWVERFGPSDLPVLITGETGTGKELIARALHRSNRRTAAPFVAVNCGAIPEHLIESVLFGHRKGAFTGAVADQIGFFEAAHRGMVFLDEIGDLPPSMQVTLLRWLDSGELYRVGQVVPRKVDVRVVAATNRPLATDIASGRFRADLYYRIAVLHVRLPPLRERVEDIDALIAYWLPSASERWHKHVTGVAPSARELLLGYAWPGNIRELFNVIQRAVSNASGELLVDRDIADALHEYANPDAPVVSSPTSEEARRILNALEEHQWNRTDAARSLGIDRSTLWRRLLRLGLTNRRRSA